ncbi:unnamed protein product [Paramecium pentaurelia]|uniref:Uncharacterized protein n=1 Tax=Paramecium pentaurelia TaxID=43138 RepID=A0A8S1UIQ9_9CILI|nr:unnamed protein product [Paramecium pentaurelia]
MINLIEKQIDKDSILQHIYKMNNYYPKQYELENSICNIRKYLSSFRIKYYVIYQKFLIQIERICIYQTFNKRRFNCLIYYCRQQGLKTIYQYKNSLKLDMIDKIFTFLRQELNKLKQFQLIYKTKLQKYFMSVVIKSMIIFQRIEINFHKVRFTYSLCSQLMIIKFKKYMYQSIRQIRIRVIGKYQKILRSENILEGENNFFQIRNKL